MCKSKFKNIYFSDANRTLEKNASLNYDVKILITFFNISFSSNFLLKFVFSICSIWSGKILWLAKTLRFGLIRNVLVLYGTINRVKFRPLLFIISAKKSV